MTDDKELQEQAYELAEYIHRNPAKHNDLTLRIAHLTGISVSNPKIDPLVEAVEGWLEKFK